MGKIFSRSFSTREKVLFLILAILLIAVFYYLAVFQPSVDAQDRARAELSKVEDQITEQQVIAAQVVQMKREIADAQARGITPKELPSSDNTKAIITELNDVLSGTITFNISFGDVTQQNGIVRRVVKVSYTTPSIPAAEAVLTGLMNCRYSCMVTDFSISAAGTQSVITSQVGSVTTTAVVTFFESA